MPSLFKSVQVNPTEKRSIPLPVIKTPLEEQAEEVALLTEQEIQAQVNSRVESELRQRWQEEKKKATQEIEAERKKMLAEVEKLRQEKQKQGQEQGYAEGAERAKSEADKLMAQIRASEQKNLQERAKFVEESRKDITNLVISASEAVLKLELENTEQVMKLINRAIDELVSRKKIVVFVHPSRYDEVVAHAYLLPPTEDGQEVLLRIDPTLGNQVFRVEDDRGSVVIDLPQDLKLLGRVLSRE